MGPLAEGAQVLDDEGVLHLRLIGGEPCFAHVALVDGLDRRLARHAARCHGEVHPAHLVAHVHAQARRLAGHQAAVEHVLRDHAVAALGHHVAGVLDELRAADDGRHGRVVLEVLEHLVHRRLVRAVGGQRDGGHEAQRDGVPVRVEEASADVAVRAVADEEHRRALALRDQEAVLDDVRGQLEHLLDADRHLGGLRAGVAQAALAEQAVHALGDDRRLGGDLVLAGAHADDPAGPVLQELLHGDAADVLRAGVLGLGGQPLVEGRAQHGVGVLALLCQLVAGEVDGHVRARVQKGDALVGDLALQRSLGLEVGEHFLQAVRVDAPAGHVLRAGEVAALDHQHALARRGRRVGRHGACAPRAHDDNVEIGLSHVPLLSLSLFSFPIR